MAERVGEAGPVERVKMIMVAATVPVMRLGTVDDRFVIIHRDQAIDVASASGGRFGPDPMAVLERWDEFTDWATRAGYGNGGDGPGQPAAAPTVDGASFGPPVPRPRQVFAVALNYPLHAEEVGLPRPAQPLIFTKYPTCLTGPDTEVTLPSGHVDWEVELVVVVGRGGHRIPRADAWSRIAGLTVGQDLSERRVQATGRPAQFALAKSFPGFGPTGPVLVTPDEFPDPDDLALSNTLNGTVVQQARTSQMLFSVPELVARISAIVPLLPGDLIFTGTPAGVGARANPPRYLRPGDVLVGRIEGIGEIRTRFTADTAADVPGQATPASSA